jgi:capsular exopolysaccharide synthesis family protein
MSVDAIHTEQDVDLREYLGVIWRRKRLILAGFVLVLLGAFGYLRSASPRYSAEARMVVEAQGDGVSMVDAQNPLAELLSRTRPDTLATQLQAMQISPFLNEAEKRVRAELPAADDDPDVRVENLEATDIISVRVTAGRPEYAARLANAIVDLHLEQSRAQSLRGIRDALAFTEREAERTRAALAQAEDRLMRFRKQRRVEQVTMEEQERARLALDLQSRTREIRADLESVLGEVNDLRAQLNDNPEFINQVVEIDNPRVQQLRDQIAELEQRRTVEAINYKPTSPIIQQLDTQLRDLGRRLSAEPLTRKSRTRIPNARRVELVARLREREDEARRLRGQYNRVNAELQARESQRPTEELGTWEIRQAALTRERDQAQKMQTLFLDKLQDLRIREKANRPGARVLLRATAPGSPSFPNPPRILVVACILGLIVGLAGAFVAERLDDRVHTPEEAERLSQSALLANVPEIVVPSARLLSALPSHSAVSESYRSLRSAIAFETLDEPIRTILITSVTRGEGKSLTSVNLASAIALDGKRVLLLDADLRRPTLHTLTKVEAQPGLSEFLNHRCSGREIVRHLPDAGFDLIPSGAIPSNPSELLNTPGMTELLHSMTGEYDVILIDSSPCTLVTDALVMATKVDGVILVVDVGRTHKLALRHARDLLDRARARVLGMVFNRAGREGRSYYGRYGYYGPVPGSVSPTSWKSTRPTLTADEPNQHATPEDRALQERLDSPIHPHGEEIL